jgi:hypothetical protein
LRQKRDSLRGEANFVEHFGDLHGEQDADAADGKVTDEPVQRVPEVFARSRCERELDSVERVDHQAFGAGIDDGLLDLEQDLIGREVERAQEEHADLACISHRGQVEAHALVASSLRAGPAPSRTGAGRSPQSDMTNCTRPSRQRSVTTSASS